MRIARYINKPIALALGFVISTQAIAAELSPVFTVTADGNWGSVGAGIPAGVWYVGVHGYATYSGVSLKMTAQ